MLRYFLKPFLCRNGVVVEEGYFVIDRVSYDISNGSLQVNADIYYNKHCIGEGFERIESWVNIFTVDPEQVSTTPLISIIEELFDDIITSNKDDVETIFAGLVGAVLDNEQDDDPIELGDEGESICS